MLNWLILTTLLMLVACKQPEPAAELPPVASHVLTLSDWRDGKPQNIDFGAAHVAITPRLDDAGQWLPEITVSLPDTVAASHLGFAQFGAAESRLIITELDRDNGAPELLFSQYSGGAHCCTVLTLLHLQQGRWHVIDAGSWDGGDILPVDLDGDGAYEITTRDDRFLYKFASYAGSTPPTLIFKLADGALQDMSADPRFQGVHQQDHARLRDLCQQGANGACAGMVAAAARLGHADEAWAFMLAHHDRTSTWELAECKGYAPDGRCIEQVQHKDFPAALASFLRETGYVARDWSG